ncbi:MAG: DUF167 domain-containing protein [Patescibacteria group bacterium]|nr:DUF167 domain-containing protein [Patescibacteria group bacterium]
MSNKIIKIRVIPRAKRPEIVELDDGSLKVKLKSPPLDNRANQELIETLSKYFDVPKSKIIIASGKKSRNKIVEIKK